MNGRKTFISLVSIGLIIFCASLAQAQHCSKPITHQNFISAIIKGKREKKSAADFIELIKSEGVDFTLTSNDVQTLKRLRYLGQKGLDDLQKAVHENRCKAKGDSSSISQAITNSPGAIQVGRDMIINSAPPPRTLSPKQALDFIAALKQFPPIEKIHLGCFVGSEEACAFANQLLAAFREARWPIEGDRVDFMTATSRGLRGLVLFKRGKPMPNSPLWEVITTPTLRVLRNAFGLIDIDGQINAHTTLDENTIEIYVGAQP